MIKYTDKTGDQTQLTVIFNQIKILMQPYIKGSIEMSGGKDGQMYLVSKKKIEVAGRKMDEVWFASILIQKGYVGFYYMPIYGYPALKEKLHPDLVKLLKGKSCFHIKKLDANMEQHISEALEIGYLCYEKMDWVD